MAPLKSSKSWLHHQAMKHRTEVIKAERSSKSHKSNLTLCQRLDFPCCKHTEKMTPTHLHLMLAVYALIRFARAGPLLLRQQRMTGLQAVSNLQTISLVYQDLTVRPQALKLWMCGFCSRQPQGSLQHIIWGLPRINQTLLQVHITRWHDRDL